MTWTTAATVRAQVQRLWDRGELLRPLVTGEPFEPRRLVLKGPTATELASRYEAVREWIAGLQQIAHVRIEWRVVNTRAMANQRLPETIWVDTLEDAHAIAGKRRDVERFRAMLNVTAVAEPALVAFLLERPLRAIDLAEAWPRLLTVVGWVKARPRPNIYLRQVDLPGVHTKFIEQHAAALMELLDRVLDPSAVVETTRTFARRYGFREKPGHVRFRSLDPCLTVLQGVDAPDLWLDAASFSQLRLSIEHVFITENEVNFLVLPPAACSIAIFGEGYGWEALGQAEWLQRCRVHYWGDIDTHGFAILDQLRARLPHVASFLMDRATLQAHASLLVEEPRPISHDLPRLTPAEAALYEDLRGGRMQGQGRLEQERIGFEWVEAEFRRCVH